MKDIDHLQDDFQKLIHAEAETKNLLQNLREEIASKIAEIKTPGVNKIASPGPKICIVRFSAIKQSRSLNLTSEYYNQDSQAKEIDAILSTKTTASDFLKAIQDMIQTKSAGTGKNKTSLNQPTIEILQTIQAKLEI